MEEFILCLYMESKGAEDKFLDFMSPEWQDMVAFTADEAKKLDMGVDLTLGTGWCYGGPGVDENTGLMRSSIEVHKVERDMQQFDCSSKSEYLSDRIETVLAVLPDGSRVDVTGKLNDKEKLIESFAPGTQLYVMRMQGPTYLVKRAAPGGEGYMLDPFSPQAFDWYSGKFHSAFESKLKGKIRAIYHDSYEYYNADWTSNFYEKFKQIKGYDLKYFLPELSGETMNDTTIRVLADYREVAADLHIAYISRIKEWADKNQVNFRNQAHGSPTNWLDTYSAAGISETESFGSSEFNIPGLDRDSNFIRHDKPDKLLMKFASSAAHVTGGNLVSSETHTWLQEHFQVALSHCKPELDKLFLAGINHVFYHGIAYSPKDAAWPGWLFYAESNFAPSNSIYRHFPAMNDYVARCQSVLQAGKPDNDILLYFPVQDIWHSPLYKGKKLFQLTVHDDIIRSTPFYQLVSKLDSAGFSFDYISDRQLLLADAENKRIKTAACHYKVLVIPPCKYLPVEIIAKIEDLIRSGIHVVFMNQIAGEPAGFSDLEESEKSVAQISSELEKLSSDNPAVIPSSKFNKLSEQLLKGNVLKENFPAHGLSFIRRKMEDGYYYFVSNLYSGRSVNEFVPLAVKVRNVVLMDPVNRISGKAEILNESKNTKVHIQLEPGESIILKATSQQLGKMKNWKYIKKEENPLLIDGIWNIQFIEGGPELPSPIETQELKTWTELGNTAQTQKFGGTARYSIHFEMPHYEGR